MKPRFLLFLPFLLSFFVPAAFAQLAVYDPANHLVNLAIQSSQQASHVEILRQWATELEKLNQQIRQMEDLLATQRRLRDVAGDPVGAGVHVAGALGATDFARSYGETMQAVRRLSDAVSSLQRTAEGVYRRLDDRTALGTGFTRRTADYRPYAAVERQADNLESVFGETATRSAAVQAELARWTNSMSRSRRSTASSPCLRRSAGTKPTSYTPSKFSTRTKPPRKVAIFWKNKSRKNVRPSRR
jgi:hypothetical protein